jgi:predicted nicotinamide N-methyase
VAANAEANGVEIAFTADNLLEVPPPAFDLICAGDVFYEGPMAEAVLAWLKQARTAGTTVLVGDPGRTYFPKEGLSLLAEYRVPTTRELEDQEVKRTRVWSLDL